MLIVALLLMKVCNYYYICPISTSMLFDVINNILLI